MEKSKFVKELGKLIQKDQVEIEDMYLKDKDTVAVQYINGYIKQVNIAGDSNMAILVDVAKAILW